MKIGVLWNANFEQILPEKMFSPLTYSRHNPWQPENASRMELGQSRYSNFWHSHAWCALLPQYDQTTFPRFFSEFLLPRKTDFPQLWTLSLGILCESPYGVFSNFTFDLCIKRPTMDCLVICEKFVILLPQRVLWRKSSFHIQISYSNFTSNREC